ncbi:septal ring lytic transglycosylase RlpA family protein [Brucepastera parasyntrophica]|uniref:septal ring lytic transglycosylase RlpA family protein n=1 Tax=Brucepastera parasyntrophica TaxID=2880008 RepID=UPI00210C56DF|nr:septal ring lytic transglycosylase RlpA family protein [Brucepastera parasyntrophica]ULQ60634.1 septal ring lytic transglycosylase RlpA family protein [Brucepastera parasyntrophica]
MAKNYSVRFGIILLLFSFVLVPLTAQPEVLNEEAIASFYADEFNGRPTSSGEIFNMNDFTAAHKTLPFGTLLEVTNLDNGQSVIVRVNDRGPFAPGRELDVSKAAAEKLDMLTTGTARVSIIKITLEDAAERMNASLTTAPVPAAQTAEAGTLPGLPEPPTPAVAIQETAKKPEAGTVAAAQPAPKPAPAPAAPPAPPPKPAPAPAAQPAAAPKPVPAAAVQQAAHTGPTWRIQIAAFTREENATRLVHKMRQEGFSPAFERTTSVTRVVLPGIPEKDLENVKAKLTAAGYTDFLIKQESW